MPGYETVSLSYSFFKNIGLASRRGLNRKTVKELLSCPRSGKGKGYPIINYSENLSLYNSLSSPNWN